MDDKERKNLCFVGDIHGNLRTILWEITQRFKISDSNIIFCGDFGVGFGSSGFEEEYNKTLKEKLEKFNLCFYVLRGNHDNPEYFDGQHNFSRLIFLQDHVPFILNSQLIYPVGGAVSCDKEWRIKENKEKEKYGSKKRIWWPGERITKQYTGVPNKVDIVISHEAPMDFEPIVIREGDWSPEIVDGIIQERNYLSWILRKTNPEKWFHGHYHRSTSGKYLGTVYRGLEINEIFMLPIDI